MTNLEIIRRRTTGATQEYEVVGNVSNYTDDELLDLCDRNNWGGNVIRTAKGAIVAIYFD